jgi:hypothetical protein
MNPVQEKRKLQSYPYHHADYSTKQLSRIHQQNWALDLGFNFNVCKLTAQAEQLSSKIGTTTVVGQPQSFVLSFTTK